MYCYLEHVKDGIDQYPLERINCFERPAAIVYDSLKKNGSALYLLYLKFFQSYYVCGNKIGEEAIGNYEEQVGVKRHTLKITGDLTNRVIDLLNQGYPILVPGNLKALYYSEHYMVNDWKHLFIVKGYDEEKKLFRILDGIHHGPVAEQAKYYDTVIRMEDLEAVFSAYKEYDAEPEIVYYEEMEPLLTEPELVKNFLVLFLLATQKKQYMEYKILKELQSDSGIYNESNHFNEMINEILNIPKYRAVMIQQLVKILNTYQFDTEALDNAGKELEKICLKNAVKNVKYLVQSLENNKIECKTVENNIILEQKIIKEIHNSITYLESYKKEEKEEAAPYLFENNKDLLISYRNNEFLFKLYTGKTYNTWIEDNCPKVRIFENKMETEQLFCSVKLEITELCDIVGHQEGIYFTTEQNLMYTVGINYLGQYIFDFVGKGTIFSEYSEAKQKHYNIYLYQNGDILSYGRIDEAKQFIKLGEYQLRDKIIKIGFFCKTWEECKQYEVIFGNYIIMTAEDLAESNLSDSLC